MPECALWGTRAHRRTARPLSPLPGVAPPRFGNPEHDTHSHTLSHHCGYRRGGLEGRLRPIANLKLMAGRPRQRRKSKRPRSLELGGGRSGGFQFPRGPTRLSGLGPRSPTLLNGFRAQCLYEPGGAEYTAVHCQYKCQYRARHLDRDAKSPKHAKHSARRADAAALTNSTFSWWTCPAARCQSGHAPQPSRGACT